MINNQPVIFNMATMPSRLVALRDTVNSILPQADELHIYLNNFQQVPDFLIHPKISAYLGRYHMGDIGDVGKFYKVADQKGYIFTVDDKILYPPDYVERMVDTIERSHRKAVVSNHGRNFHSNRPSRSYYFDIAQAFNYMMAYPLTFVHEIGTGVLGYHSSTVTAPLSWFPYTNMTDIYFSLECQKLNIPIIIHPHDKGWLRLGSKHNENHSIHYFCNRADKFQTKVINDFKWKINTCQVDREKNLKPETRNLKQENLTITFAGLECYFRHHENDLAVVLPVFNNLHYTRRIITALQEMRTSFMLIIIDDGSTDGTRDYIHELIKHGNNIIYCRHQKNTGVNTSWNEGIHIARSIGSKHIAVLNNDLELTPDWERSMLRMLQDNSVGIVSPYSTHGSKLPSKWPLPGSINPLGFDILGCCFMFRADLIDKIGYIPETLHTYYGDNWFSHAAKRAGLQVIYCKDSIIHHYWQQTTGKLNLRTTLASDLKAWNQIVNRKS
jgi:GT2 family glycosyltransferase